MRTGRHEGDWELVQFRVTAAGRPVEAVYAQHSGAERCGFGSVSLRGGRPVVFSAHGSHASYLRAGTRDRMWPDPNDEADGRGVVISPAAGRDHPRLARRGCGATPWGGSRGRWWVPPEQDSPLGPGLPAGALGRGAFAASAGPARPTCDDGRRVRRPARRR